MLRSYIVLLLAFFSTYTFAQNIESGSQSAQVKEGSQIDYKQIGAPMPPIRLAVYGDSSSNKGRAEQETNREKKKRNKQADKITVPEGQQQIITNADVDNGANLFIMLFNPTCAHCQDETAMLEQNIALFKKSKFLMMVTPVMKPYLPDFVNMLHVLDYPVFTVGVDSSNYMNDVFLYHALPQINIYNSERKLIKVYSGEVSLDTLKQYIE